MDTTTLLQIIGEVFAGKADHHEMEIVAAYFADRSDLFRDLHENKHEVVLGRRGTGKTMVLKHLSFDSQLHLSKVSASSQGFTTDFAGFYVSLALEDQPKVGPEDDPKLEAVFDHWFNLLTLIPVLAVLEKLSPNPRLSKASIERFTTEVSTNLFGQKFNDLDEFKRWVADQERDIRECCSWPVNQSLAKATDYINGLQKITSVRSFHARLITLLKDLLTPLFPRGPRFYFLLDRFDEVSPERQNVIKHIIQVRPGQAYFVKLGVSHSTKLHLMGVTYQDYRILNIEHDVQSSAYSTFCETVLKKRFAVIREKLKGDAGMALT